MPLHPTEIRAGLTCAIASDGHWRGWYEISLHAVALHRLGLHPAQPTATPLGPTPPAWWHAAAERRFHR